MTGPTQNHFHVQSIVPAVPHALQSNELNEHPEEDFIKLMVAQLQNQDPEKPTDGTALVTQVTQMNAAVAMQRMSFLQSADSAVATAAALLGHAVQIKDPTTGAVLEGKVSSVDYTGDKPTVKVNNKAYPLTAVNRVDV